MVLAARVTEAPCRCLIVADCGADCPHLLSGAGQCVDNTVFIPLDDSLIQWLNTFSPWTASARSYRPSGTFLKTFRWVFSLVPKLAFWEPTAPESPPCSKSWRAWTRKLKVKPFQWQAYKLIPAPRTPAWPNPNRAWERWGGYGKSL